MENLEIEYKVMVSKDDFKKVEKNFSSFDYIDQTNYYYETNNNDLKKNNLSLRLRKIKNKLIATLKESKGIGRLEHEFVVDSYTFPTEIIFILKKYNIDIKDIKKVGELRTIRKEIKIDGGLLCLDHSFYNDKEDYEIEFEHEDLKKAREVIESLLNKLNVKYSISRFSKTARALKK